MLSGPLKTHKERELIETHEQAILTLQAEIDKLRDGKTTLRLQRTELREEVERLNEEIKTLRRKKND